MTEHRNAGTLIQRGRQRKRMTQQQLADALGVSRWTVTSWERGEHFPRRHAGAIEEVLCITIPVPEPETAG